MPFHDAPPPLRTTASRSIQPKVGTRKSLEGWCDADHITHKVPFVYKNVGTSSICLENINA